MKHTISLAALALVILSGSFAEARDKRAPARERPVAKTGTFLQCDFDPERAAVCYRCQSESDHPERDQGCRRVES